MDARPTSGRWHALFAATLLAVFAGLSFWEMTGDSLTSDERVHLPAGYAYWKAREFRLNPEHPPLVKLLCAAALLALDLKLPPTRPDPGVDLHTYEAAFGSRFLFSQDADRILFWGRLPALLLALLLVFLLYRFSREIHGRAGAGFITLLLAALDPALLAHGHYVHTDVPLACFGTLATYGLWRFSRRGALRDLLLATLGLGLALAAKFSAIVLVPVFALLVWIGWPATGLVARGRRLGGGGAHVRAAGLAASLFLAALCVRATYLLSPDPWLYVEGILTVNANHATDYAAYVHGKFHIGRVVWYPLYAFLLKTPLPTLLAVGVGAVACLADRARRRDAFLFLCLPAGVLTLATCLFADNIGVRYMIPVGAWLLILAGGAAGPALRSPLGRVCACVLVLWLGLSVAHAAPHFLSYFNEIIGGPANGPYFLEDSNVDWGQDLKRLARYQREQQIPELILAYWGPTQPDYYGIRWKRWTVGAAFDEPPPGVYAISVNHLINLKRRVLLQGDDPRLDWLERYRPDARVGYSIFIYRMPGPAPGR